MNKELYRPQERLPFQNLISERVSHRSYACVEEAQELILAGWTNLKKEIPRSLTEKINGQTLIHVRQAIEQGVGRDPSLILSLTELPKWIVCCRSEGKKGYLLEPTTITPLFREYLTYLTTEEEKKGQVNQEKIITRIREILNLPPEENPSLEAVLFSGKMEPKERLPEFFARHGFEGETQTAAPDSIDPFKKDYSLEDILISLYIRETNMPLLTHQQEVLLAALVWLGKNVSPATNPDLWLRLKPKIAPAKHWLILANTRWAYTLSKLFIVRVSKEQEYPTFFLDLIQAASEGLIMAADHFDFRTGIKFSTYSKHWITNILFRELSKRNLVVLPQIPQHQLKQARESQERKSQEQKRTLDLAHILAEEAGIKPAEAANYITFTRPPRANIITIRRENPDADLFEDTLEDPQAEAELSKEVEKRALSAVVENLLGKIPAREEQILRRRFGIGTDDNRQHTLKEVGNDFGITRERARQIEAQALKDLRNATGIEELKDWW